MPFSPQASTAREREGWVFQLTPREVALLRMPITDTPGGWQSAMREAATRIHADGTWRVSDSLMQRLFRMCVRQGRHGGYQSRLPLRVLSPVFASMVDQRESTWLYGRREVGDTTRIKIGKADNLKRRTPKNATDNPRQLELVFKLWDRSGTYERRLHRRLQPYRIHGEWYHLVPEVRSFVELCVRVQSTDELPPLP